MKYFSEVTQKVYDTPEALEKAEKDVKEAELKRKLEQEKAANTRKARAEEVDAARKKMVAAQKEYRKVLEKFCEDYGAFHRTINVGEIPSLFDSFFEFL